MKKPAFFGKQTLIISLLTTVAFVAGCSSDDNFKSNVATIHNINNTQVQPQDTPAPVPANNNTGEGNNTGRDPNADYCDPIDPSHCLLPFPNDYFTKADNSSVTGKRINFDEGAMPINKTGEVIQVDEYNRNDGFSPGATIILKVPGIDLAKTGAASLLDLSRSLADNTPILVIDAETKERQLIWAELDANASSEKDQALIIQPAKNFQDGHRYIVALRNLKDSNGNIIGANAGFKVYRDKLNSASELVEQRRSHMEELIATLAEIDVKRNELFLAWDFTVASTENISARVLHMRDQGLGDLDGKSPSFTINTTERNDETFARIIRGEIAVPNYLDDVSGKPGSRLNYVDASPDTLPSLFAKDAKLQVPFTCVVPPSALEHKATATVLQHGLFGNQDMVLKFADLANEGNMIFCGMDWMGMSKSDLPFTSQVLQNIDLFPSMADRLMQAYLNIFFLTEVMQNAHGFVTHEAFRQDGKPLYDNSEIFFDGISQGAVLGGGLVATSPHFKRAILDVPGMNFSLLLRRSSEWGAYSTVFYPQYPDELERPLILALIQMLWDRAEFNGYANHLTADPLPNTLAKKVLIHAVVGDRIVAEIAAENAARTIGAKLRWPAVAAERHYAKKPYFGIEKIDFAEYPYDGSAIVIWDGGPFPMGELDGIPVRSLTNKADTIGRNPHIITFDEETARHQKAQFLQKEGFLLDVCNGSPCYADGYDGTPGKYDPTNAPAKTAN